MVFVPAQKVQAFHARQQQGVSTVALRCTAVDKPATIGNNSAMMLERCVAVNFPVHLDRIWIASGVANSGIQSLVRSR
jgi:hypothetical protein